MDVQHPDTVAPTTDDELYHALGQLAADAGIPPPLFLKNLKSDIRATPHPRRALINFHRFIMTGFSSSWLRDFDAHRLLQQILLELSSQSQFLADILVRNPELFRWLTTSTVLKVTKSRDQYAAETADAVGLFQRSEKRLDALKRFQRRELLRIGARQVLKEADVATTSAELSALADAISGAVLSMAYDQMREFTAAEPKRELAVIGLGKLGGEELNFSSDIDLMFVYEQDGPLEGASGRLSTNHEYYCRVAEYVVRRMSEHTGEGHLYRVDMRLRPDGGSGPLAMSRGAYVAYYESRGELWERQMLIKARVIAGSPDVGMKWMDDIQPFVYPKTLLTSPLEEIARIKARIEQRLQGSENIKLGSGGIRDIEFTVQALQLLNGGARRGVRQRGTLAALRSLAVEGQMRETEARDLDAAYRFLRTVEDRLQLLHGLQKHEIPELPEERMILARQLGFQSTTAFIRKLASHQARIRKSYAAVFGVAAAGGSGRTSAGSPGHRGLQEIGFQNPGRAGTEIEELLDNVPELKAPGRLAVFFHMLKKHRAPDWCLKNFVSLANSTAIRRTLQQAVLIDKALELLTLLASRSSRISALLARQPLLFEALLGRPEDLLLPGSGWSFLKDHDLPRYKSYNEFKSIVRLLVGETTPSAFTRELSGLADDVVRAAWAQTAEELRISPQSALAAIALGKLGGSELSISSDLDLVLF
ncbi:MAG TPA: hypothetical protein VMH23_01655, partial [Bacteroidota bacterium]|nr:hypothetical protein [Bacteroidota bacterium]